LTAQAEDIDGFFFLEFMGERTRRIDAKASTSVLEGALRGLSTVSCDVLVTKQHTPQSTVAPISNFGWYWSVTFVSQTGDLPSILVNSGGSHASTTAAGGMLLGTGVQLEVSEVTKGSLPNFFVTPPSLSAKESYTVRVSAYNARGWSSSEMAPASMYPAVQLPAAPASAAVSVFSSTSLEVSWVTPLSTGGAPVLRYQVQWDMDTSFDDSAGSAVVDAVASSSEAHTYLYRIEGLSPGVPTVVRVMAANERGYGTAVFADPVGFGDVVHELRFSYHEIDTNFVLNVTRGKRSEITEEVEVGASATVVQDALQKLETAGTVVVTRQSTSRATGSVYSVTFLAPVIQEAHYVHLEVLKMKNPLPSPLPSGIPSSLTSAAPSQLPSGVPTPLPSGAPSALPSASPSSLPSGAPTPLPSPTQSQESAQI